MHYADAKTIRDEIDTDVAQTLSQIHLNLPSSFECYNFTYRWIEFLANYSQFTWDFAYNDLMGLINRAKNVILDGNEGDILSYDNLLWMAKVQMLKATTRRYRPHDVYNRYTTNDLGK